MGVDGEIGITLDCSSTVPRSSRGQPTTFTTQGAEMSEKIVVGGNVQGDISSCEYKVSEITTGRPNLWVVTKSSLAVNNCSGETLKNNYWVLSGDGFFAPILICITIWIVIYFIKDVILD